MKTANQTKDIVFWQAGLRFFWNGRHDLFVETPAGAHVGFVYVGDPVRETVTLDELQDAIDAYCEEHKRQ